MSKKEEKQKKIKALDRRIAIIKKQVKAEDAEATEAFQEDWDKHYAAITKTRASKKYAAATNKAEQRTSQIEDEISVLEAEREPAQSEDVRVVTTMADREKQINAEIAEKQLRIKEIQNGVNKDILTHEAAVNEILSKLTTGREKRRTKLRQLKKEKRELEDACFVATALYGDLYHPVVCDLRCFRDKYLLQIWCGRAFVSLYYMIGPKLAKHVSPESKISYRLRQLIEYGLSRFNRNTAICVHTSEFISGGEPGRAFCQNDNKR